jgi:hypothetical protein
MANFKTRAILGDKFKNGATQNGKEFKNTPSVHHVGR